MCVVVRHSAARPSSSEFVVEGVLAPCGESTLALVDAEGVPFELTFLAKQE